MSKVCEKIALSQFTTYLLNNNRLTAWQRGNKKAHSTETLNIYLTDCILEAMDRKKLTVLVLLYLSKAFDSIRHQKLLLKLSKEGKSPSTVIWFKSYLSGHSQSVRIDYTLSDPLPITHGVPKGAVLSPYHCFSASASTICPRLLVLAAWSHTWMTRKYSCHSRWQRLIRRLRSLDNTCATWPNGAVQTT